MSVEVVISISHSLPVFLLCGSPRNNVLSSSSAPLVSYHRLRDRIPRIFLILTKGAAIGGKRMPEFDLQNQSQCITAYSCQDAWARHCTGKFVTMYRNAANSCIRERRSHAQGSDGDCEDCRNGFRASSSKEFTGPRPPSVEHAVRYAENP